MTTYFISDLHLKSLEADNSKLFFEFVNTKAKNAKEIYILGDFFDAYIGDDYINPCIQSIKDALIDLYSNNVKVFFMRGNRDFLITDQMLTRFHCIPINDPYVIELNNSKILLMHGDLLTTLDSKYKAFRKYAQNKFTKSIFLNMPIKLRLKIVSHLRNKSKKTYKKNLQKKPNMFDVVEATVEEYVKLYDVKYIIHGHIHKPNWYKFDDYERIVLGDWDKEAKILSYENGKFELFSYSTLF